jgi:cation diffusion facilitator family transporter
MSHGSKKVILVALAANFGIAIAKFVAFLLTRSSSMLAESIHSVADTSNQLLLLLGMKRAARPPDEDHPFGYKMESYFWSFIVALLLFSVGGLFAIYEAAHKLGELNEAIAAGETPGLTNPIVAIAVLSVSIALEGYSWMAATREVNHLRGDKSMWQFIQSSKSTEIIVIWMEDTGALIGLLFALCGVGLTLLTGNPYWDVYATFAIGVLLVLIAFFVSRETKSLLIGESADKQDLQVIAGLAKQTPGVVSLMNMRSMQLGNDEFLVTLKLQWEAELLIGEVSARTNALEDRIRATSPWARYIIIEPDVYDPVKAATVRV